MMIQDKIAKNVKLLRIQRGLTQEQLADLLNLTSNQYANYERAERSIPIEVLVDISNYFHIAVDALIKFDLSKVDLKGFMKVGDNRLLFPILINEGEKFQSIEIVPMKASAGYLKGYADPEFIEGLPRMVLPFVGEGTHRAFPVGGDSMLPVKDDSVIVGKYVEKLEDIKNGKTYIIITKDGILYKRVYNKIKVDGKLYMTSDNKSYAPISLEPDEISEIWSFKCLISTKEYEENEFGLENVLPAINGISKGIEDLKAMLRK
jgi:transcriptional regulator with XRE-family HTH domain